MVIEMLTLGTITSIITTLIYQTVEGFYNILSKEKNECETKDIIVGTNGEGINLAHTLVVGTTGSGKSVCLNNMIEQLIKFTEVYGIDLKGTEFIQFEGKLKEYVRKEDRANEIIKEIHVLMEHRLEKLIEKRVPDYNYCYDMKPVIIVVDEFQTLIENKEIKRTLYQIISKARATNIHLILSCQCPRAEVIEGRIKDNIINTIIFRCETQTASEVATSERGNYQATKLKGKGHGLIRHLGEYIEFQGLPPLPIIKKNNIPT